jgi:hypothetical protein
MIPRSDTRRPGTCRSRRVCTYSSRRPPDRRHHEVTGLEARDLLADLLHHAEVFVPEDEVTVPVGLAVQPVIDLRVSAAQAPRIILTAT